MPLRAIRRAHLPQAERQHRAGKVHADDTRGTGGLERDIGRARAHVDQGLAAGEPERRDGPLAPSAIDPGTQQMIEQVVPRRDCVEHARDAIGGLVGCLCHPT